MKKKVVVFSFIVILCSGLFFTGKGLFIFAKACLAQVLLETSWETILKGEGNTTPWPWADFKPMACLLIPGHKYRTIVVNSASGTSLAFAPGHLDGSALPGSPGNCVIFGHRETHFRVLKDLRMGDAVRLSLADGRIKKYKVAGIRIVDRDDVHRAMRTNEKQVTLVTCYPFDSLSAGDKRFVVIAKEVL